MTTEAAGTTSPPDEFAELTGKWAADAGVSADYARLIARIVENSFDLSDRTDLRLAHLLHRSLRASVVDDAAPPEEIPVLTAPELHIEHDGGRTYPLSSAVPDSAEAFRKLVESRHSVPYSDSGELPLGDLGTLLYLALGTRELIRAYNRRDVPSRMAPSAGGLQPNDAYLFANRVADLAPGIYFYNPVRHELVEQELGDFRPKLVEAAFHTDWLFYAPAVIALVGNFQRVAWKYGTRGYRYVNVDTGVSVMNLCLAASALDMSGNAVAAFDDDSFNALLRVDGVWEFTNLLFATGRAPRSRRAR